MKNQFYRKVLKNGMTILFEKRTLPVISAAFAVRYGGVNETLEEMGIAHFIEHMLYKGTKKRTAKNISEEIEKKGGILNGFTGDNMTAFWCKIPSRHLNTALDVLSDMIKNSLFNEKELEKERKVIFEEMKLYHDNPQEHVFEKIQGLLYGDPLGTPLIGTVKSMNSIDRKKMTRKFQSVYAPNNLILCVVGDADFRKIVNFAERKFGKEKSQIPIQKIRIKTGQETETRGGIDQANLVLAYHSPLSTDSRVYAAKILIALMAQGLSSRLFQEIREKRNLAYSITGDLNDNRHFSYSYIYVGTMKDNVKKVKKLILDEFEKVSKSLTDDELNAAKEQVIGNFQIARESSVSQMNSLLSFETDGNAKDFYNFEKNIGKVKLKDVKNLAKKAKEKYSFFALVPK